MRNHLRITAPDETTPYLEVHLNGQPIKNLIALRVEVPSGEKTPLLKATLEFYTAIDLEAALKNVQVSSPNLELSTQV